MEKPLYPSSTMRITQGYNEGSHIDSFAIDDAGKGTGIEPINAPFTGIIKKIYSNDANEVWLESIEPVEYPDGTIDYMTIMFAHANDVSNLFVGKQINKGEAFYSEGTKGNATGNHCHIECGKGKFTGTGWYKNSNDYYSINNGKKPEDCLWIDETITILNDHNYKFKRIEIEKLETNDTPVTNPQPIPEFENKKEEQVQNTEQNSKIPTTPELIFTCPKTDLYGIYLKKDQKLYLD